MTISMSAGKQGEKQMGQFCHLTKKNSVFNMVSNMEFCLGTKQPKNLFWKDNNKLCYGHAACFLIDSIH